MFMRVLEHNISFSRSIEDHGIGLRELTDQYLPGPRSNRGVDSSVMVDAVVLMLQGGRQKPGGFKGIKA